MREMKKGGMIMETDPTALAAISTLQDAVRKVLPLKYGPEPRLVQVGFSQQPHRLSRSRSRWESEVASRLGFDPALPCTDKCGPYSLPPTPSTTTARHRHQVDLNFPSAMQDYA